MKLHIYRRDTLERTLDLTGHDLRIGRGAENDVVLEDADKTVSRFHAELRFENDEWILIDLNSQNGTWIDGERIQRASLAPAMTVALGHFRLVLEDPNAPLPHYATSAAPADDELAPTIMMSAGAVQAAAAAHAGAGHAGAQGAHAAGAAPAAAGAASAGAASAAAAKGAPQKRPKLTDPDPTRRPGAAMIPRPIFYGACAVILTLIVGVMYVMRPQPAEDYPAEQAQGPAGPETNAQIIARELEDGRAKLEAGNTTGAIEAATRALLVDPNHPEALDLKMKAEEKRHQDSIAGKTPGGATPQTASTASTTPGATPAATTSPSTTTPPGTATPSSTAASTAPAASATGPGTPASTTASTQKPTDASGRAKAAEARKEKAAIAIAAKAYSQGKSALSAGRYREAIGAFESALLNRPNYQDAAALLEQARAGVRGEAQKVASQAQSLASSGDLTGALREYERARQIDPSLTSIAAGVAEVRGKMKGMGDEAYKRGRQLEAVGRLQDATMQYTRAAEMLPADDANGRAARERLENLKRQP